MCSAVTPVPVKKKRDLSSPLAEVQQPNKKTRPVPYTDSLEEESESNFTMAEGGEHVTSDTASSSVVHMSLQPSDLARIAEMLKSIMTTEVKDLVSEVVAGVTEVIQGEISAMKSDIKDLQNSVTELKAENRKLQNQNTSLQKRLSELDQGTDALEQYTRRNSVRVSGIPEAQGESTDGLVLELSKDLKAGISNTDIDRSHRVGAPGPNKTRAIIVKFATYNARRRFMDNRKSLKNKPGRSSVFINEDLTRIRSKLLYTARNLVKSNKLSGAWSSDGRIYVRTLNGERRVINNTGDLRPYTADDGMGDDIDYRVEGNE